MELIELPFRKFPKIRHMPPETKRVSEKDLSKLLSVLVPDFKDMVVFGLLTGLRPNELRKLTPDEIRTDDRGYQFIHIEGHKTSKTAGETKPRSVPLCSEARAIVRRQVEHHPDSDFIFQNNKGKPYTRQVYRNRLIRNSRKAGIGDVTPYALRHTFASMESDAGVETTSLASLMGHSEIRTLKRYVTNNYESHLNAVQKVEERLLKAVGE